MESTIVALATPPAQSAIAVIRLSGSGAVKIAAEIFRPAYIESIAALSGYRAAFGHIFSEGRLLDEAVAIVYRAPKSYTGEDMVELCCHGSPQIAARVTAACIAAGARAASAEEFTRRAFENGKLDLSQAEAIAELIACEGERAAAAALDRRQGGLSAEVSALADSLSQAAAALAVWSDYPEEEDSPAVTREGLSDELSGTAKRLEAMIAGYNTGRMIQNGITCAIIGSPNAGKSTLANLLSGSQRSIVTDIAGTTRDIIEAPAEIDGIALRLLDTAGIRDAENAIERIGVDRAYEAAEQSDLALLLIDGSRGETKEDIELFERLKNRPHLVVYNKNDLPAAGFQQQIFPDVEISAATGEGLERLREAIKKALGISLGQSGGLMASQRQFDCAVRAKKALDYAVSQLSEGVTLDVVGILLEEAVSPLAELLGKSASEAVIEQVFAKFCVGK